jgi:hypothetical protein
MRQLTLLCIMLMMTFMKETCQLGTDLMSDFYVVFLSRFDESVNQFQYVLEPTAKRKLKKLTSVFRS